MEIKDIDPHTLRSVSIRYDTGDKEALKIIQDNAKVLVDVYEGKFARLYWTCEDRETLAIIIKNKLASEANIKLMLEDLKYSEEKCAADEPNTLEIIDNLGVFLELCFRKTSPEELQRRVRKVLQHYTDGQIRTLLRLISICQEYLTKSLDDRQDIPPPNAKKAFIYHVCYEFLRDADHISSSSSRIYKLKRLNAAAAQMASYPENKADELFAATAAAMPLSNLLPLQLSLLAHQPGRKKK